MIPNGRNRGSLTFNQEALFAAYRAVRMGGTWI